MDCVEAVCKNKKPITAMCEELQRQDSNSAVTNLTDQQWTIARDLTKILVMPRSMMMQFTGDTYVTISNVDLGVCQTLESLALAQSDPDICLEVRLRFAFGCTLIPFFLSFLLCRTW